MMQAADSPWQMRPSIRKERQRSRWRQRDQEGADDAEDEADLHVSTDRFGRRPADDDDEDAREQRGDRHRDVHHAVSIQDRPPSSGAMFSVV